MIHVAKFIYLQLVAVSLHHPDTLHFIQDPMKILTDLQCPAPFLPALESFFSTLEVSVPLFGTQGQFHLSKHSTVLSPQWD